MTVVVVLILVSGMFSEAFYSGRLLPGLVFASRQSEYRICSSAFSRFNLSGLMKLQLKFDVTYFAFVFTSLLHEYRTSKKVLTFRVLSAALR